MKTQLSSGYNVPAPLFNTLDTLEGCQGRFLLFFEKETYFHNKFKNQGDYVVWSDGSSVKLDSVEAMLDYCVSVRWNNVQLLWQSDFIDDRNLWPGGYNNDTVKVANARVIRGEYQWDEVLNEEDGISLDVRFIKEDLLETITSLESYPLISEDEHSQLTMELEQESWEGWAASEWRDAVVKEAQNYIEQSVKPDFDADDLIGEDNYLKLYDLFRRCCEDSNTYWQEEQGSMYIDIDRVIKVLTIADIRELTGLSLLSADQAWRFEPYPWPDGSSDPLMVL